MINYIVIGVCIFLLLLVIFISAKPIGMGIEARREIKDNLKEQGIITDEEYQKAKKKILD